MVWELDCYTNNISSVFKNLSLFFFFPNALPQIVAKTLRYILPLVVLFLFLFIWKSLSLLIIREIWLMRTYRWELFANWISTIQSSPGTIRRQCEESISNKAWCLKSLMKGSLTCRAQSHPPLLEQIPEVVRKHREKDPSISSLSTCAGCGGRDPGCLKWSFKTFPRDLKAGISWYHVTNQSTHGFGNGFVSVCFKKEKWVRLWI